MREYRLCDTELGRAGVSQRTGEHFSCRQLHFWRHPWSCITTNATHSYYLGFCFDGVGGDYGASCVRWVAVVVEDGIDSGEV
ncbi:Hypothetical predicted protein [Olea europaea subsp. europaea]|uniref:Uncharacterized protein n=1 Tax=Olea europaea subsp. europaea TaxID=158383 RepID=A0A8S0UB67_OLEEU|nr:Hypothetical predicted protein [Olea europaea subsp. europaea]